LDHMFEFGAAGPAVIFRRFVERSEMRRRGQLHAHGCHFAELDGCMAVIEQRLCASPSWFARGAGSLHNTCDAILRYFATPSSPTFAHRPITCGTARREARS